MNAILDKESFSKIIPNIAGGQVINVDFLYNVYEIAYGAVEQLLSSQQINNANIDSFQLISYILGEYLYSTTGMQASQIEAFLANEQLPYSMGSVSADKYLSLSVFNHQEKKLTNRYLPPISSINLYVNLMLNIVSVYKFNDAKNALILDMLRKSLSIARSIINLLCEGYETEAFAIWRTLHECECTLILMNKYGDVAINAYLKHMKYGIAYRSALNDEQDQQNTMEEIKKEMAVHDLKSKDTKKFIEYGWLYDIPESKTTENFKLNFRDGLETLAGLHSKSEIYMTSSEILHSTPLLIYSNKNYFYYITLLNLYESFFRIEEVFQPLFFLSAGEDGKRSYLEMKKLYYSQLLNIYKRELLIFKRSKQNKR